jgi:dipeptidyl aminopeptidase/acylaminoacyl peptidase
MIKAVIALAAPSDLTDDMYLSNMIALGKLKELEAITGKPYVLGTGVPAAYLDASPRFYPKKIPTLLIHGKADDVVPFNQAGAYQVILNNTKCYNRLFPLSAAGYDLNLTDPAVAGTVFKEMQNWCWQFGA